MTLKDLIKNVGKQIVINATGRQSFSDAEGLFYLVGYKPVPNKRNTHRITYCGEVARAADGGNARFINLMYLEPYTGGGGHDET